MVLFSMPALSSFFSSSSVLITPALMALDAPPAEPAELRVILLQLARLPDRFRFVRFSAYLEAFVLPLITALLALRLVFVITVPLPLCALPSMVMLPLVAFSITLLAVVPFRNMAFESLLLPDMLWLIVIFPLLLESMLLAPRISTCAA